MKDNTFYFPHDYNASQDSKIIELLGALKKNGLAGLAIYWIIVEILHQQPDGKLSFEAFKNHVQMYCSLFHSMPSDECFNICSTLVNTGLIKKDGSFVTSDRVTRNKQHRDNISRVKSFAGKVSAAKRLRSNNDKNPQHVLNTCSNEHMLNIIDKIKEDKRRAKSFYPPTTLEVKLYCDERKSGVNPERFCDYYIANGWKVGKNPMKDWKAAIRTWEKNAYEQPLMKKGGAHERPL